MPNVGETKVAPLTIGPSDLVFFVDETGHEEFADAAHPVFGYGGCAVMALEVLVAQRRPEQDGHPTNRLSDGVRD